MFKGLYFPESSLGVGIGKGPVRFEEAEEDSGEEEVGQIVVIPPEMDKEPEPKKHMSLEATRSLATFRMEEVNQKLQTAS